MNTTNIIEYIKAYDSAINRLMSDHDTVWDPITEKRRNSTPDEIMAKLGAINDIMKLRTQRFDQLTWTTGDDQ